MNEKEFNLAILKELRKIAGKVFAKVTVSKEGTYTAAELWNGKNSMGEKIEIFYMGTSSDIYTAKVDTFEFKVSAEDVFLRLWKFERLCGVRQEAKERFTYGDPNYIIINEKSMYLNKDNKPVLRKKTMEKISDNVSIEIDKKSKKYNLYYYFSGIWYLMVRYYDESQYKAIKGRIDKDSDYIFMLLQKWDFESESAFNPIYKALFEAMKPERANSKPEQRKYENEPENSVICDVAKLDTSSSDFNKGEALKYTEKRMREKHPNYIALIRYNGMYYSYGESAKNVRLSDGARDYITDTGDYICFPESLLDDVLPKLIKAGRGVLTCDIIEGVPEDYQPEPYNEADADETEQNIEKCESSRDNQEKKCIVEHVSDIQEKNMRPNYLRQKVFPTESFQSRRKISRFNPRYFAGYTNYHLCKENALERKRNGNTSVYRALIRGETKNNILICR